LGGLPFRYWESGPWTARYGWAYDTWSKGKGLKEWMHPDLLADLDACWFGFGEADNARALLHSMALFDRLTRRTGDVIGYPAFDSSRVRHEVQRIVAMASVNNLTVIHTP